ncbi:MAG: hypothetical protein K6E34_13640 [Lachnospiraceae bacterium]|nr:hypothetical protein [Lachnospiraceae bacterium]
MARTPERFCEEMKQLHPDIQVIGEYTKAVESVAVKCLNCGKEWSPKAYSLISGKGCPHCSAKKGAKNNKGKTGQKDHNTFITQMQEKHPNVKVIGNYLSTHSDIECQCTICGHKWITKPYSLLQGHGCPKCAKSGTSFMEQLIYLACCSVFGEDKVHSRDRKTIGMELDIVIPDYKIAIEPGNWFLHEKSFSRDSKKRVLCSEKGYRLITVYDKYPMNEPPFDTDCYVFTEDLNIADHVLIRNLIVKIIKSITVPIDSNFFDWDVLEKQAYENAKAKTHEDFVVEMKKTMPSIEIVGKYVNANRRVEVKCKICGFTWNAVPANISRGDGCRKCGAKVRGEKKRKKQEDFENELKNLIPSVKVIGTYISRHKPIKVQCLKCGTVWEPTPGSLLRRDRNMASENNGCPLCAKSKQGTPRKKVINTDTGEIFESSIEAGKKYNIVPSAIRRCCRGLSITSKGFHWKYYEE